MDLWWGLHRRSGNAFRLIQWGPRLFFFFLVNFSLLFPSVRPILPFLESSLLFPIRHLNGMPQQVQPPNSPGSHRNTSWELDGFRPSSLLQMSSCGRIENLEGISSCKASGITTS
ncbi:hypothetical protein V8C44DRAFT_317217 [Trichoderma aethiopicum]